MIPYGSSASMGVCMGQADPDNFHPERVDKGNRVGDPTKGPSWPPFGGGDTLCTGRYIARPSTLSSIALVLRRPILGLRGMSSISGIEDVEDFMVKLTPGTVKNARVITV
ncbi:unnamed protein product [Clonostachys chloroleuca]|uniref:Cytochrome P450 n=1 Tax=Clonostachys chloroleuca TaxID=1926264 RepID=A0AA35LP72_9HYPO|nr:unnamed protein product [Clonostachys chloroleuca]